MVTGRLALSREAYDQAIPSARALGNHRILANVLVYRGVLHHFQSEYAQAEAAEAEANALINRCQDSRPEPAERLYEFSRLPRNRRVMRRIRKLF